MVLSLSLSLEGVTPRRIANARRRRLGCDGRLFPRGRGGTQCPVSICVSRSRHSYLGLVAGVLKSHETTRVRLSSRSSLTRHQSQPTLKIQGNSQLGQARQNCDDGDARLLAPPRTRHRVSLSLGRRIRRRRGAPLYEPPCLARLCARREVRGARFDFSSLPQYNDVSFSLPRHRPGSSFRATSRRARVSRSRSSAP